MVSDALPASTDRELLRETVEALRQSSRGMVRLVLASLKAQAIDGTHLDAAFGPEPSTEAYADAVAWNLTTATTRRQDLIAESLSRRDVADRLGVSPQAISDMLDRGALLGLKEGREWRLPVWQLDAESPTGVVPGVGTIGSRFPGSVVALSRWIARENPDLDGQTPLASLRRGHVDQVVRLVDSMT